MPDSVEHGPVVVFVNDLVFETKIRSTGQAVGAAVSIVRSAGDLGGVLDDTQSQRLIVDLNHTGGQALEAIALARGRSPAPHIVAYVSHVDAHLSRQAADAGADEVMPRSRFSANLPEILRQSEPDQSEE